MEEKELKTSVGQRVAITLIAIIMLGSIIAGYVAIVVNGSRNNADASETAGIGTEKVAAYEEAYDTEVLKFKEITAGDFTKFSPYLSEVNTYDEEAANTGDVKVKEILAGDGRELTEGDTDYLAYYVGWCADGSVFDTSVDSMSAPTGFKAAIDASQGLIEGWTTGVIGMKLGGIRRLTIPGELAYGENREICGGYNKPLRFLIMAVPNEEPLKTAVADVQLAYMKMVYAYYGIDYDAEMTQ